MPLILFVVIFWASFCPVWASTGINRQDSDTSDGTGLINKMVAASSLMDNYSYEYKMSVFKNSKATEQIGTVYFRKPKLLHVDIKKGPNKGAVAILCDDGKIHGHLGGAMKFFPFAIPSDSGYAKAINGAPMAEMDFYSLALYLKNMLKIGNLSQTANQTVATKNTPIGTCVLSMYSLDKNVSAPEPRLLKRIYVNPQTYLPIYWEDYINGKLLSQSLMQNVRSHLTLSDGLFKP
jgi:outer membrane lipoprotein-sorting protein